MWFLAAMTVYDYQPCFQCMPGYYLVTILTWRIDYQCNNYWYEVIYYNQDIICVIILLY